MIVCNLKHLIYVDAKQLLFPSKSGSLGKTEVPAGGFSIIQSLRALE